MSIYEVINIGELLRDNSYPGRGIVMGMTGGGKAVCAYFITGRSDNSRNRIFEMDENGFLYTRPFDEKKVEDPSLIIYRAAAAIENHYIVTNGDQTDTIYEALKAKGRADEALMSRRFEPDEPNFTPRISGIMTFGDEGFTYEMSILKSGDSFGKACNRQFFRYEPVAAEGHFIHTYEGPGDPLPSFRGEPRKIQIPEDIDTFTETLWNNLNEDNKISLYVSYADFEEGTVETRVINKNGSDTK